MSILFSGRSNQKLADELVKKAGFRRGKMLIKNFSDGEIYVRVGENIKDKEVFILQSLSCPAGENLCELLLAVDALKDLAPKKISAILPFFAYRRQERKKEKGEALSAKLVARLLEAAGVGEVFLVDIHSEKIMDFFGVKSFNLEAASLFADYFKKLKLGQAMVVAPDLGALADSRRFAEKLGLETGYITKKRVAHDKISSMALSGEVAGKNIIIIDDEINTGGTICEAAELLKQKGAKNIYICCSHAVFSGSAVLRLKKAPIKEIIITDTISLDKEKIKLLGRKLKILSIAPILAGAIKSICGK